MSLRLTPLPAERFADWQDGTRNRLIGLGRDSGMRPGADAEAYADRHLEQLLPDGLSTATALILTIEDDIAGELGTVWLGLAPSKLFIIDLAFGAEPDRQQSAGLLGRLKQVAREHAAARITMGVFQVDAAGRRFTDDHGFTVSSIQMILDPLPERAGASRVAATPMTSARFTRFRTESVAAFADDLVTMRGMSTEEALAESRRQFEQELSRGIRTPGHRLYTASVDGEEVGILWFGLRQRGETPHAFVLDIEVAEHHRRQGFGREIMLAAESEARRLGARSMGLHVFGANHGAVALYEQLGYRRVEELFVLDL